MSDMTEVHKEAAAYTKRMLRPEILREYQAWLESNREEYNLDRESERDRALCDYLYEVEHGL